MALLERVGTLLRANLNDLIDRAEEPEKMVKQIILDITKGAGSKTILLKEYDPDAKLGYILATDWQRAGQPGPQPLGEGDFGVGKTQVHGSSRASSGMHAVNV